MTVVTITLAAAVMASPRTSCAQSADKRFDVVSVKPNNSGQVWATASPIKERVGRYTARNVTLKNLITWFYDVNESQIIGGPRWLETDRFDIDAVVDGQPTREEVIQMLRALLADRFNLEYHSDTRNISRYRLIAPKKGLKYGEHIMRSDNKDCGAVPTMVNGCRGIVFGPQTLSLEHVGFAEIAQNLAAITGQPVVNETGLAGKYNITLDLDLAHSSNDPSVSIGDAIIIALREQIGLPIEVTKGATRALVIDRAERPTGN
ncbi:MAG: TIGR03435 family protein [Acidobacteriia bacterium]|nr:TIGR03435 family protein [Terriglobia bacterium]